MNLKAKNKKTGEIVKCPIYQKGKMYTIDCTYDINEPQIISYTENEFNTLYEVISDTQEGKVNNYCTCDAEHIGNLCPIIKENLKIDTGWREKFDARYTTHTIDFSCKGDRDNMKSFISEVETQAYKQGQADAYRESRSVAIKHIVPDGAYSYMSGHYDAKHEIR